jgi:hypothetical protein
VPSFVGNFGKVPFLHNILFHFALNHQIAVWLENDKLRILVTAFNTTLDWEAPRLLLCIVKLSFQPMQHGLIP